MSQLTYTPTTAYNRIIDIEIPPTLEIRGKEYTLPKSLTRKRVGFLINEKGELVKNSWIAPALGHILASESLEDLETSNSELYRAKHEIILEINKLIKDKVLRDRQGPGIMAFSQANENVPEDSILMSKRTYDALCNHNSKWKTASTLMVIRFPNLGPETTKVLKLVVNYSPPKKKTPKIASTALGNRLPILADLFKELSDDEDIVIHDSSVGIFDCLYIHPTTLKNCFEGDGDGKLN